MPEGHVIHRLAAELDHAFAGRTVTVSSPQGRFAEASALLDQTVFRAAEAFGKHLILDFSPPTVPEELREERTKRHQSVPEELREERTSVTKGRPSPERSLRSSRGTNERHEGPPVTPKTVPEELASGANERHEGPPVTPGPFVHIHLGLIGKLRWVKPDAVDAAGTLRLRIQTDEHAAELRGPQACALVGPQEVAALVAALGPDPLRADADPERGWRRVHRSDRTIASLLMDQRVAAGVGNIYRAEVLYRQRIHPDTPGSALSRRAWNRIWADFVELMPQGVVHGRIDTVRPEDSPEVTGRDPRVDRHGGEVYVYRRQGQPCLVCGREVSLRLFEGRNLYWCPRCQRRR